MTDIGLDVAQLRTYIIEPVLDELGLRSESAVRLLIGTALIETRLRYVDQLTPGPGRAYGLYQMEEATHKDIWNNYLRWKPALAIKVRRFSTDHKVMGVPNIRQLWWNFGLATAETRVHYLRVDKPLPHQDDFLSLAWYYKRHYNTVKGKADPIEFVQLMNEHLPV